jgi:hypothetical protein
MRLGTPNSAPRYEVLVRAGSSGASDTVVGEVNWSRSSAACRTRLALREWHTSRRARSLRVVMVYWVYASAPVRTAPRPCLRGADLGSFPTRTRSHGASR